MPKKFKEFREDILRDGLILDIQIGLLEDENSFYVINRDETEYMPAGEGSMGFQSLGKAMEDFVDDYIGEIQHSAYLEEKSSNRMRKKRKR